MDTKIHERVARLEERYINIQKAIDDLADNHIAHLEKRVRTLYIMVIALLLSSLSDNSKIYTLIDFLGHLF